MTRGRKIVGAPRPAHSLQMGSWRDWSHVQVRRSFRQAATRISCGVVMGHLTGMCHSLLGLLRNTAVWRPAGVSMVRSYSHWLRSRWVIRTAGRPWLLKQSLKSWMRFDTPSAR